MTYENCIKYRDEADNEKDRLFWDERVKRKYPEKIIIKEPVKEVKKTKKKVVKE